MNSHKWGVGCGVGEMYAALPPTLEGRLRNTNILMQIARSCRCKMFYELPCMTILFNYIDYSFFILDVIALSLLLLVKELKFAYCWL